MKLIKVNPHLPLNKLIKMKKEDLLAAIHSKDVLAAGMSLRKDTLVDWLNFELNSNPDDMEVK